jgi:DNA-binding response OmpR family regulator
MGKEQIGTGGVWLRRYWEYGPLVLDSEKSIAFLYDEDLQLSEQKFDALYLLIKGKGAPLSAETLYKAVWELPGETDERETARLGMESLVRKLNAVGRGVIWIDEEPPGKGYALRLQGRAST